MLINSKQLKQKIEQYCNKAITKDELGLWSMQAYYELMKGEYIEIDKLQIYHFLRTISTFHQKPNDIADEYPCTEEEVINIKEILCGKKDIYYTFNIKIFKNIYQNEIYTNRWIKFEKLKKHIDEISLGKIAPSIINEWIEYINQNVDEIQTLIDLLECHIKGMISENLDTEEKIIDFRQSVGIYAGGININKENFIPNLKKLLACIMGNTFFRVSVVYKKGIPYLSLILL